MRPLRASIASPWLTLGWDDDDIRRRSVCKSVIWDDLHSAAGMNRGSRLGHRIKTKWMILATGSVDILEDLPWSAEVDNHCAFRNQEGYWDAALGGRLD